MTLGRLAALVGIALLVMIANIAMSILYMVVYGHVIDPGHDKQYYQEHIKVAAPYCSIVAGVPLMFLTGLWVRSVWGNELAAQSALAVWLVYALIDFAVLAVSGFTVKIGIL